MENLFTHSELEEICEHAQHPDWLIPNMIGFGLKKTTIFCVSIEKGLILAQGNEFTGTNHIRTRHRFGRQEWKEGESEEIDRASQFSLAVAPIDYMSIAESIYEKKNLKPSLNGNLDQFEVYEGKHTHQDGQRITYRLVVYKGTPVIHTLFPVSDKRNKAQVINLRAGGTRFTHSLRNEQVTYTTKYYNRAGKVVIKLIIKGIVGYRFERYYVEVSEEIRTYPVTTFIKELVYDQVLIYPSIQALRFEVCDTSLLEM
ncbi:MAG: hypothetical protein EOO88_25955 [Pedobacter sp.]|nr:MAG: hypothetical protein EOO88_25955 [Pedobacter sp.]